MLKFSVALLFLIIPVCISSQAQSRIDSLKILIQQSSDTTRFNNLMELVYEYGESSRNDEALTVVNEAYNLAIHLHDTLRITRSGRWTGQLLNRLGRGEEAIKILSSSLVLAKDKSYINQYSAILNTMAITYTNQAKYDKALYYNFQSLEERVKLKDTTKIAIALNNIGLVYYKLDNNDKAIIYYKKVLDIQKKNKYDIDHEEVLNNLCLCYVRKGDFGNAKKCLNVVHLLCSKRDCDVNVTIHSLYAEGELVYGEKKLKAAEIAFLKSYRLSDEYNNKSYKLENIISLVRIYIVQKRFDLAEDYLNVAVRIGSELTYNSLQKNIYKLFSDLYNQTRDYKNASKYQAKYIQLRDSIYSEELTQNLMVVQAEYEQRENKARIESQKKVLALKEDIIDRQNILEIAAAVAIVLLALLILALYRNNKQKKIINSTLEQKVQERTQELEASYALIQKAYLNQNNFIEKAAKDIKGPLSTMKGLCSLGLKEASESEAQQYLIQLNAATDQLALMVNNLKANS